MLHERLESVIYIERGKEHSLQIRDIHDSNELLYPAFQSAQSALKGILESAHDWYNVEPAKRTSFSGWHGRSPEAMEFYDYANNIIAFCAGRGQGKTSAMLSLANALENHSEGTSPLNGLENDWFYILPPIDPTVLEGKESIMEIVLSHLFYQVEQQWKNPTVKRSYPERYSEARKTELLLSFRNCFNEIRTLQDKSQSKSDALETLYQLGDSFDLKSDFYILLKEFFGLLGQKEGSSFLVIQLDDTDLQVQKAFEVLEETRKYLSLPNVIVLMATDLDQLRLLVFQHYYQDLKLAAEKNEIAVKKVRRMAAEYLDKLIPSTHAIYLPNFKLQFETNRKLFIVTSKKGRDEESKRELQKAIFDIIYEKTGLIFVRHRYYMHNIIPESLRGVQHLFRLLDRMEQPTEMPVLKGEGRLTAKMWKEYCQQRIARAKAQFNNLTIFEGYFLNDWCSSRLNKEDWDIIWEIHGTIPLQSIRYAVNLLPGRLRPSPTPAPSPTPSGETEIGRDGSYTALNKALVEPEQIGFKPEDYAFAFAMHTYFSIQFNKLALEAQIRSLNDELSTLESRAWKEDDTKPFSFDYSILIGRITPTVFDSEGLQQALKGEDMPQFFFADEGEANGDESAGQKSFFIREDGSGYCDLLYYFYHALSGKTKAVGKRMIEAQRVMLDMQDCATYVCCNWDVQDQICKAISRESEFKKAMDGYEPSAFGAYANAFFSYLFRSLTEEGRDAPNLLNLPETDAVITQSDADGAPKPELGDYTGVEPYEFVTKRIFNPENFDEYRKSKAQAGGTEEKKDAAATGE